MAFRSLVLVSLLLAGCAGKPPASKQVDTAMDAMAAVNTALAKKELTILDGVPVLK